MGKIKEQHLCDLLIDKYWDSIYFALIFQTIEENYKSNLKKFTKEVLRYFLKLTTDKSLFNIFILKKAKDYKINNDNILQIMVDIYRDFYVESKNYDFKILLDYLEMK